MGPDLSRRRGHGVLVEFVGLPGAGKSSLSRAVADRLRASGLAVSEPAGDIDRLGLARRATRKAVLALLGAANAPVGGIRWGRALLASGQRSVADSARVALNWFYVAGLLREWSGRPGAYLFDQGPVQALWSAAYASRSGRMDSETAAASLHGIVRAPTLIVLVHAAEATLADRLRDRVGGDSRLERDLARGDSSAYARATGALTWVEELLDRLARPGQIEVGRASGEREAELGITARRIADQARRLIGTGA